MGYIIFFTMAIGFLFGTLFSHFFHKGNKAELQKSEVDIEFMNIAIHQVRALLTNISWIFEKLLGKELNMLSQDQYDAITLGKNTAENAINVINDTLNAAIVGRVDPRFRFKLNDINKVLENIVSEYSVVAKERNIQFSLESSSVPIPLFFFDSSQLYLALHDLVHNAIKYTKYGGKVLVRAEKVNNSVKMTIQDNGIGIPKEQIGKIFTKFFRADNAKKIEEQGSGLGLFIAKKIISRHNGGIEVRSAENEGTTIEITLPLSQTEPK